MKWAVFIVCGIYFILNSVNTFASDTKSLHTAELWNFYDNVGDGNRESTTQIRYYIPIQTEQRRITLRLDTSAYSQFGDSYPNKNILDYHAGTTKITVTTSAATLGDWKTSYGLRTQLPMGSSSQILVAPHVGATYVPQNSVITEIAPVIRYFHGFDKRFSDTVLARNINFFPTVGLRLSNNTELKFWDENPIVINLNNGKWFVPLDLQVIHNIDKTKYFIVGTSQGVIRTNNVYTNSAYFSFAVRF